MSKMLTAVFMLTFCISAQAAEYFVSELDGDDSAAGTENFPLRTIPAALKRAVPGDFITVEHGAYEGGFTIRRSGITLRGSDNYSLIDAPADDPDVPVAITIAPNADNVRIEGFDIRGGYHHVIHIQSEWDGFTTNAATGVELRHLGLRRSGITLLRADAGTGFTLEESTLLEPGVRDYERGLLLESRADSMTLQSNVFIGGYYTGVDISGGGSSAVINGNYFTGTILESILVDPATATAEDYVINGAVEPVAVSDLQISNNFFHYLESAAIVLRGSNTANIVNNTFLDFRSSQAVARFQRGNRNGTMVDNDSLTIINNLLEFDGQSGRMAWAVDAGAVGSHDFDNNAYNYRGGKVLFDFEGNGGGLAVWRSATGQAANSMERDPEIDSHGHLDETSPLRNAGRLAGSPGDDYDRQLRRDDEPDIGADEYFPRRWSPPKNGVPASEEFVGTSGNYYLPPLSWSVGGGGAVGLLSLLLGILGLGYRWKRRR